MLRGNTFAEIKKIVGYVLYNLIGKHLPRSTAPISLGGKAFRAFCGKLMLQKCGKNVNIEHGAEFSSTCTLGDNSGIGINCSVGRGVHIGKNVMMGPECVFLTRNHAFDRTDIPMMRQGFQSEKPIVIEDDVWIGRRVTILPGVHVGQGAIIGACAVVTHDVGAYDIIGGNPARVIRNRKSTT